MRGFWLLSSVYFRSCSDAFSSFVFDQEKHQAFIERTSGPAGEQLFLLDEGVARIPIVGTLTKQSDFFFDFMMGGSAIYGNIQQALAAAEGDDDVERIVLEIDSPGGEVAGFFETAVAIAATKKPIEAQITDLATSAAYGLAAAADRIIVNNPMAMVGSIGVVTSRFINENRVDITSSAAPNKRPDVSTDAGIKVIERELDAIHAEFVGIIVQGRGKTEDEVNAEFGRGANILAKEALQVGMIDVINIETSGVTNTPTSAATSESEFEAMTREELQTKHPTVYAAILALGVDEGTKDERDRVSAHIVAGKANGCLELSAKFIADGSAFTGQTVQAEYMSAGLKKTDLSNRAADDAAADAGDNSGGRGEGDKPTDAEQTAAIFSEVNESLGLSGVTA